MEITGMKNAPYNFEQNWDEIILKLRENVIRKINKTLNINIQEFIKEEKIYTPKTIETITQSHLGSLYGTSSNSKLSAFLRHPNFTRKIKNLYLLDLKVADIKNRNAIVLNSQNNQNNCV